MSTVRAAQSQGKPEPSPYSQGTPRPAKPKAQAKPKTEPKDEGFARLPHRFLSDKRLSATDTRILGSLLYWAKDHPFCWPSDTTIGDYIGCHRATVSRRLKCLEALGLVRREKFPPRAGNMTGRVLHLPWHKNATAGVASDAGEGVAPAPHESPSGIEKRSEREAADAGPATGGPPPAAARAEGEPQSEVPSPAEVARWRGWLAGRDRHLTRIARVSLEAAGLLPPTMVVGSPCLNGQVPATYVAISAGLTPPGPLPPVSG